MRVGYLQFNPRFGEVEENVRRALALLSGEEADLWVLPELFSTGYHFTSPQEARALAEPVPSGPTTQALLAWAGERGCHIAAGLAELAPEGVYNSAVLVGPQGLLLLYRKAHLFWREKENFLPGDTGFQVAEVGGVKVGLMVCFDHLFPEAARTLALKGAQIIAHPANLVLPGVAQLTTRVRALENRLYLVTANRTGEERRGGEVLRFTGQSQIVSPQGEVLASSTPQAEEAVVCEIDPEFARQKRINPYNDLLSDRRLDLYFR
ncbi:hypothetical protein H5T52_03360 [Candidatus Bipolaricaulota bacterium]|nr:hypothetical protein [Candidatus Bipolaricaulota bacterium]